VVVTVPDDVSLGEVRKDAAVGGEEARVGAVKVEAIGAQTPHAHEPHHLDALLLEGR